LFWLEKDLQPLFQAGFSLILALFFERTPVVTVTLCYLIGAVEQFWEFRLGHLSDYHLVLKWREHRWFCIVLLIVVLAYPNPHGRKSFICGPLAQQTTHKQNVATPESLAA
jgi:hypothetical protein